MIFIVEDDENIREMESYALKNSGFEVFGFADGKSFFDALEKRNPLLIVLDIMLPGEDGMEILKKIKTTAKTKNIPVIMVTAKTSEIDVVKGLDNGADDYITKPFGIMEFISRVKAVLRRALKQEKDGFVFHEIYMDDKKRTVTVGGTACELTFKEYELLKYFMSNEGIVLSREMIMDKVWGTDFEGESRTLDMHIKTLRHKLGDAGGYIKTVRNVGYKLETL